MTAKLKLINSLLKILQLPITSLLKQFVEGEIAVLFLLFREKSLTPTEIAKELTISKGRVANLLNSLVDKEEVDVAIDQADRRKFQVSISEKGKEILTEKLNEADMAFDKIISSLGEEKTLALVDILETTIEINRKEE